MKLNPGVGTPGSSVEVEEHHVLSPCLPRTPGEAPRSPFRATSRAVKRRVAQLAAAAPVPGRDLADVKNLPGEHPSQLRIPRAPPASPSPRSRQLIAAFSFRCTHLLLLASSAEG